MNTNVYETGRAPKAPQTTRSNGNQSRTVWLVPAALILLSIIPLIFGVIRLNELASGATITPANARFFAAPLAVVLHIIGAIVFAILGAFQFVSRLWRRGIGWHRWAGRILVPFGLVVGLSGIWMTLFYPSPNSSPLLYALRLFFGSAMVLAIVLGFAAIRRRDILSHRAWMTRGYAIGLGAATQVLTGMVGALVLGTPNDFENAVLIGAAWVINLAVAEWFIRRRPSYQKRTA